MNESRYSEIKELGSGTFGVVKLIKDNVDGALYACKEVGDVIDILVGVREVDVMKRVCGLHPSIVNLEDYSLEVTADRYRIKQIMELCPGGSLEEMLRDEHGNPDKGIKRTIGGIRTRLENLLNIVSALASLQNNGVYHMDVKTENILYRKPKKRIPEMCLCDFSNYYLQTPWKGNLKPPAGPIEAIIYRPPEVGSLVHKRESFDRIDVWAMGVVIAETMGAWGLVQNVDTRVGDTVGKFKALFDKIQLFRNNRKNGGKRETTPRVCPVRSFFPGWFFRDETLGKKLGNGFSSTSVENEMVHSLLYAKVFSSQEFHEEGLKESVRYFTLRKEVNELFLLSLVFERIIPACLKINPEDRITMEELARMLAGILENPPPAIHRPSEKESEITGMWDRVDDPIWRTIVVDFYESTRNITMQYGRIDRIKVPPEAILYAKRIAEEFLQGVTGRDEDLLRNVLSASMFIASELMDFIFPYEDCCWFSDTRTLSVVSPYIKQIADSLMGKFGSLSMSSEEEKLLSSDDPITIS